MLDALLIRTMGGVFLLLYGVRLTGQGFERAFGARLTRVLAGLRGARLRAFAAGALSTSLVQSAGAVVAMIISFTEAAPLPLSQSLAIVIGADLGSIVTVQILSFRIYEYVFFVISAGGVLYLWSRKGSFRAVGQGILGFGILLLALKLLAEVASEIGDVTSLRLLMEDLSHAPIVAFLWGVFLSAVFQSGTAVLIILIAFTQQGALPREAVLPLVLGANVGGSSVAMLAASGLGTEGKRIAWGHMLMKTAGALLFLPVLPYARDLLSMVSPGSSRIVADAHAMFNLALAVLFAPLVSRVAALLVRIIPAPDTTPSPGTPLYLDRRNLPVAGAALGQVAREIVRIADRIQDMLDMAMEAVRTGGEGLPERIAGADDDVDRLTREIKVFLSELGEEALDREQTRRAVAYIAIVTDLENIGDFIDKTLGEHLRKMAERNLRFSQDGAKELLDLMGEVKTMYGEVVSAFVARDGKAAGIVIDRKKEVSRMERELRIEHIRRLQKGTLESLETSAAHLDIVSSWKAIASHCASIAYKILEMER